MNQPPADPAADHAFGRVAAFFDLDKTVIATSSVFAFTRTFLDEGLMTPRAMLSLVTAQAVYSLSSADDAQMARLAQTMADATRGWSPEQVEGIVTEALTEIVHPHVFAEARELFAEHRALGHDLVLVSASVVELVGPIARMLGVDHFAGTRMRLDADGRYAGEVGFYCQGAGKVEAVTEFAREHGYDLAACHAYSDSATDVPMLSAVGHPTTVNPDRTLRRLALERGWPVLRFSHPVPLSGRLPTSAAVGVGVGSVLVAAGAAAVALTLGARRSA